MSLAYTITFTPGRYYVCPMGGDWKPLVPGTAATPNYWAIVDEASRLSVGFAFEEKHAKVICFSLNLVLARINGDRAAETALSRMLDNLAG